MKTFNEKSIDELLADGYTIDQLIELGLILYQQVYPIGQPSGCSFGGGYALGCTW